MDKIDFIQGIGIEQKEQIRKKIQAVKNRYGVEIKLLEVTSDLLYIQTTLGNLDRNNTEHKPLVFNLARQPFDIPEVRGKYKMSVVLGNT